MCDIKEIKKFVEFSVSVIYSDILRLLYEELTV